VGSWPVADLARLQERLASNHGELRYQIDGAFDDQGRPALRVQIDGKLELICQRCLDGSEFAVRIDAVLALATSQAAIDVQPVDVDGTEWILATNAMPVRDLLEDELLLAVPLAPRHEHCSGTNDTTKTAKDSPFSALKGLLRKGSQPEN
jgi:uncharacterized protein